MADVCKSVEVYKYKTKTFQTFNRSKSKNLHVCNLHFFHWDSLKSDNSVMTKIYVYTSPEPLIFQRSVRYVLIPLCPKPV